MCRKEVWLWPISKSPGTVTVWWCHASVNYYFRFQKRTKKSLTTFSLKSDYKYFPQLRYYLLQFGKSYYVASKSCGEGAVGTLDSEALQACFHVCVITMNLFFLIREFRSQQISSSTENIYLLKTSVIFYDSTTCFGAWGKTHEREVYHIWGRELYSANWEGILCAFWWL